MFKRIRRLMRAQQATLLIRALLIGTLLSFMAASLYAQTAPEYLVRNIRPLSDAASGTIAIAFEIENVGTDARSEGTVSLVLAATGETIASQPIPPLVSGGQRAFRFDIPTSNYQVGQRVSFGVRIELAGIPPTTGGGFDGQVGVVIPAAGTGSTGTTGTSTDTASGERFTILGLEPVVVAVIVLGGLGILLIILWVFSTIARALFAQPQAFGAWQPPYAANPMIDPNSIAGRRQLWQQHAQSDALTMPCALNSYMVRKLPIGIDDKKLSGWRVNGIRLSQYDMYGRVDRSETIVNAGIVKALDRAVRKTVESDGTTNLERTARPIANKLIGALLKRTGRRNLMLPIALDIRLSGKANEVDVLFELHRCVGSGWEMVDRWQSDLYAVNDQVIENFTYTLFGQQSGETFRAFRDRIRDDLTRLLSAMLYQPPMTQDLSEVTLDDLEPVDFAALAENISIAPADVPRITTETQQSSQPLDAPATQRNPAIEAPPVEASDTTPNQPVDR